MSISPHETSLFSITAPVEITAATILITFWDDNVRILSVQLPTRELISAGHASLAQAPGRLYRRALLPCLPDQYFRGSILWRMWAQLLFLKEYDLTSHLAEFVFSIIKRMFILPCTLTLTTVVPQSPSSLASFSVV